MKPPLLYLLEVLFCSGLLMAFYRLMLVRRVSFACCRYYLVAALLLSLVIPALDIPVYPARTVVFQLPLIGAAPEAADLPPSAAEDRETTGAAAAAPSVRPQDRHRVLRCGIAGLYAMTAAVLLAVFVARMAGIRRLRRRSRLTECEDYTLAEHPQTATPFSFLRTIFLGDGYEGLRRRVVLCHEASHIRHRHSAERIVVELVRCLCWINPFVWMAGRWLEEVQEWEADRDVLAAGYDLTTYRIIIFRQLFGYNPDIACGLNHSLTKNRFAMMTQFCGRKFTSIRFGAAIPVVAGMMMLCSFTTRTGDPVFPSPSDEGRAVPLTAVVHIASDGKLTWNDQPVAYGELLPKIAEWREQLGEEDRAQMEIVIRSDRDMRMGNIADIRSSLREASVLRARYATAEGDSGVLRMLPPPERSSAEGVGVIHIELNDAGSVDGIQIKDRNLFLVLINGSGVILAGQPGRQEIIDLPDLSARVKEFVCNAGNRANMPEQVVRKFELPDGGEMEYPVSQGVVAIQTARDTPYGAYINAQNAISKAFGEIRNMLSEERFNCPYTMLDEARKRIVMRAVPLKVSESEPRMLPRR